MILLPRWLYESLPYVYAVVGLTATVGLETIVGRFCGILLVTAAAVIAYQRFDRRHDEKQRLERLAWLDEQARKHKLERQEWLRDEARKYRERIEQKEEDF